MSFKPLLSFASFRCGMGYYNFVEKNFWKLIREGTSSFWFEDWMRLGPFTERKGDISQPTLLINDCLVEGPWNLQEIKEVLSPGEVQSILSSQISLSDGNDLLPWCPPSHGEFSISSAT